jgi:carbon monoxide dehydrogenase subunit G
VDESPFERLLSEATLEFELQEHGEGRTRVRLTADQSLRGKTRFGSMMVRRATKRTINEALDGLRRLFG